LVISRQGGGEVVRWEALDVIAKVTEVFASHDDRVAVTFLVRRGGRELIDVIAFSLRRAETPTSPNPKVDPKLDPKADPKLDPKAAPSAPPPPKDPALDKALTSARKARGKAALLAWQRVLERSAEHAEALFGKAAAQAPRDHAGALATLGKLAASAQPDAIEYLVAARFDAAFAGLRADPTFRKLVGLDRRPQHPYDRAMGFGGVWEQAGTSCDSPTVALTLTRDKKFRLQVRTVCEGMVQQSKFAGTWQVDGGGVALTLPNRDAAADVVRCSFEPAGDEEAMACPLDEDLRIVVLPARR
ncbi:MAG TPA: hypothetical protein PKU97_02690, partial [Kofleriaceae bacterium]|nr:hypothetical protein [Kofleriaceae bacterium]